MFLGGKSHEPATVSFCYRKDEMNAVFCRARCIREIEFLPRRGKFFKTRNEATRSGRVCVCVCGFFVPSCIIFSLFLVLFRRGRPFLVHCTSRRDKIGPRYIFLFAPVPLTPATYAVVQMTPPLIEFKYNITAHCARYTDCIRPMKIYICFALETLLRFDLTSQYLWLPIKLELLLLCVCYISHCIFFLIKLRDKVHKEMNIINRFLLFAYHFHGI